MKTRGIPACIFPDGAGEDRCDQPHGPGVFFSPQRREGSQSCNPPNSAPPPGSAEFQPVSFGAGPAAGFACKRSPPVGPDCRR